MYEQACLAIFLIRFYLISISINGYAQAHNESVATFSTIHWLKYGLTMPERVKKQNVFLLLFVDVAVVVSRSLFVSNKCTSSKFYCCIVVGHNSNSKPYFTSIYAYIHSLTHYRSLYAWQPTTHIKINIYTGRIYALHWNCIE